MADDNYRLLNAELYIALGRGEDDKVIDICQRIQEGPFRIVTMHNDTVLHIATRHKRNDLVMKLLRLVPEAQSYKLTFQNKGGNTIFHETALSNATIPAVKEMLRRVPSLLTTHNKSEETTLFRAAHHGKTKIFQVLHGEMSQKFPDLAAEQFKHFFTKDDKSTILHASVLSENFYVALYIVKTYPYLAREVDGDGMTALQLLACNPSAFNPEVKLGFIKRQIYSYVDTKRYRIPLLRKLAKSKHRREYANELAKILVRMDTSWEATGSITNKSRAKVHVFRDSAAAASKEEFNTMSSAKGDQEKEVVSKVHSPETPLFLATKSGCLEIVEEILKVYPQAVEHVDEDGRTILHLAIMYRRNQIFDSLFKKEKEHILKQLKRKIDNSGNTILHMVAIKFEDDDNTQAMKRSPALALRDDLDLFERVEENCTTVTILTRNSDGKTAKQMFDENFSQLRTEAKKWMQSTATNSSIVAVLIATVAFAAAYTVPGGPDQSGYPLLRKEALFIIFTMADTISLTMALTSVIVFLSILTSSFEWDDFRSSLHLKLFLGLTLLITSVASMMIAFAATVILTVRTNQEWTKAALYGVAFFPVSIFVISYVKLYNELTESFKKSLKRSFRALYNNKPSGNKAAPKPISKYGLPITTSVELYGQEYP